jgi:hypothetical protein
MCPVLDCLTFEDVSDRPNRSVGKQPNIPEERRPQMTLHGTSEARYAWFNNCGALSRKVMDEMDWALCNACDISLYSI